jgi:hypothetical protein
VSPSTPGRVVARDTIAALVIVALAVKEGLETWQK